MVVHVLEDLVLNLKEGCFFTKLKISTLFYGWFLFILHMHLVFCFIVTVLVADKDTQTQILIY